MNQNILNSYLFLTVKVIKNNPYFNLGVCTYNKFVYFCSS